MCLVFLPPCFLSVCVLSPGREQSTTPFSLEPSRLQTYTPEAIKHTCSAVLKHHRHQVVRVSSVVLTLWPTYAMSSPVKSQFWLIVVSCAQVNFQFSGLALVKSHSPGFSAWTLLVSCWKDFTRTHSETANRVRVQWNNLSFKKDKTEASLNDYED